MSAVRVFNRCLYGSRIYSHAHAESDYDYLDIIEDEDIEIIHRHCTAYQEAHVLGERDFIGEIAFQNPELEPFQFTEAFLRNRDVILKPL